MNTNKKLILVLLIFGLILSSIIRIVFNVSNGFEYHDTWLKILPFPVFDLAVSSSNQLNLTSTIVGYLAFLFAGFSMMKDQKKISFWISLFILIVLISIIFETTSIFQDLNSKFNGQHLRIGPIIFVLGLFVFYKDKIKLLKNS